MSALGAIPQGGDLTPFFLNAGYGKQELRTTRHREEKSSLAIVNAVWVVRCTASVGNRRLEKAQIRLWRISRFLKPSVLTDRDKNVLSRHRLEASQGMPLCQ